jgi:hypothetical protein
MVNTYTKYLNVQDLDISPSKGISFSFIMLYDHVPESHYPSFFIMERLFSWKERPNVDTGLYVRFASFFNPLRFYEDGNYCRRHYAVGKGRC